MDNQIRSFMRVIRKLDNADELIQSFSKWEKSVLSQDTASSSLTPQDQRCILDFPDPETQATNVAKSSTLAKEDLLERAAETPSQLSATEVSLLKDRYWLEISPDEGREVSLATGLLTGPHRISMEEYEQARKRLSAVRHLLYAENEEKAIENATVEHYRREREAFRARQCQETERALSRAFPWLRRLWEEDKGERHWGYCIFVDPEAFVDDEEAEPYELRRDGVLFHARGAIGASNAISNMWRLQRLDWPKNATADDGEEEGGSQAFKEGSSDPAADEVHREGDRSEQEETEETRAAKFQKLREHFKSIRDRAPKRQKQDQASLSAPTQAGRGGLQDGLLQNVFLVVDKSSAGSVLFGPGFVDDMWVWANDPDHDDANDASAAAAATTEGSNSTGTRSSYKGFMRVRVQQLVNNFYDARRFHEDNYSMAKLWEAAQKSKNQAFVSVKDDEARSWTMDRFVGSAMRAQPPRIVYGPKPVISAGASAS